MATRRRRTSSGLGSHGALLVAFVLAATASSAAASRSGKVRFLSKKRTYLTVGSLDGVRAGTVVKLQHKGKVIASCTIDQVGDHGASCVSAVAHVGDAVSYEGAVADGTSSTTLPTAPAPADVDRAAQALATSTNSLVDFHPTGATRGLTTGLPLVTATLSHDAYVTFGGGQYQQERLDLSLNGVGVRWAGFRVFAHITAVLATVRPPEQRFRPGDFAQVYVWETALSSREVGRPFTLSVGRVWAYHAPGLTLLDGVQTGWRNKDASVEIGVYGGTVPDPITMYPTYDHYTAGLYYSHTVTRGKKSALRWLEHQGRLGVRGAPGFGLQLELELAVQAALRDWIDFGAQARASIGATDWTRPAFETGRIHLGLRPRRNVRVLATFRYLGPRPADFDSFTTRFFASSTAYFTNQHLYHGTLDVSWDPRPWVSLALQGGVDYDTQTGTGREYFGPEISFPHLLGHAGGIAIGYREELGWYAGREAHVQFNVMGLSRVRVSARVSYLEDRLGGSFSSPAQRELGAYAMMEAHLVRWFSLRGTVMSRVALDGAGIGAGQQPQAGLTARLDLVGSL